MSYDVGGALGFGIALSPSDARIGDEQFFGSDDLFFPDPIDLFTCGDNDFNFGGSWATPWWPATGGFAGDLAVDTAMSQIAAWWGDPWVISGCNGRFTFAGITRNANGAPEAACTVRCFRTSSTELVASVTSDANGFYAATTPYGDGHFLTVHKANTPPIAGASIDTLTPG